MTPLSGRDPERSRRGEPAGVILSVLCEGSHEGRIDWNSYEGTSIGKEDL